MLLIENYLFIYKAEVWLNEYVETLYYNNYHSHSNICGTLMHDWND